MDVDRVRVFGERSGRAERIAPGFFSVAVERGHKARYAWASRWVRGRTVLDVACGTGYGAEILRGAGASRVVSVDVSEDALKFGRSRYGISAVRADAHRLPFVSSQFEVVVSLETLEHLTDPLIFLREVGRVLAEGGQLILSSPNGGLSRGSAPNPHHVHEFMLDELQSLLEKAGLQLVKTWGQYWRLLHRAFHEIRGLRRLGWEIERRNGVTRWGPPGSQPLFWCICVRPAASSIPTLGGSNGTVKVG